MPHRTMVEAIVVHAFANFHEKAQFVKADVAA
jgi:hypothetical protein